MIVNIGVDSDKFCCYLLLEFVVDCDWYFIILVRLLIFLFINYCIYLIKYNNKFD